MASLRQDPQLKPMLKCSWTLRSACRIAKGVRMMNFGGSSLSETMVDMHPGGHVYSNMVVK